MEDKAIFYIELHQLPPLRIQVQENRTTVTLNAYRKFADIEKTERIRACYQHACLKYVSNEKNDQSVSAETIRNRRQELSNGF